MEVGLIVAAAAYVAAGALWLAWHQSLFKRVGLGGAGLETPEQKEQVAERDAGVQLFMEETSETLLKLSDRVEDLEEDATGEKGSSS